MISKLQSPCLLNHKYGLAGCNCERPGNFFKECHDVGTFLIFVNLNVLYG